MFADTPEGLQRQLVGLFSFVSKFQMIVNELKNNIVVYGTKDRDFTFLFNNKPINIVEEHKYLGCIFNSCTSPRNNIFKNMLKYSSEKALKASFATIKKCNTLGNISPKVGLQLFDTCVLPVISYSAGVWTTGKPIDCIERVQLKFLKFLLGVKASTCNNAIYGETGRFPLYLDQQLKAIKFWLHLEGKANCTIVKHVLCMLKHLHRAGFKTWLDVVFKILSTASVEHYLEKDEISKVESLYILKIVKESLYESFMKQWYVNTATFVKMRTYVTFKTDFKLESYLLNIRDFKLRKCFSKFRLSSHDFEIEKGRYHKPVTPVEERVCKMCNEGMVEDEEHVLMKCTAYESLRKNYYDLITKSVPNINCSFQSVMGSNNVDVIFYTCKFLYKISLVRKEFLSKTRHLN